MTRPNKLNAVPLTKRQCYMASVVRAIWSGHWTAELPSWAPKVLQQFGADDTDMEATTLRAV